METLDLAVIESRWWNEGNDSVRGIFDMLAGIHAGNPFGYHYEMFSGADSIVEILRRIATRRDIHHIYIGAHGDRDSIYGPGNTRIRRTRLINVIKDISSQSLHGLFFGACMFGAQVDQMAEKGARSSWIAGYTQKVDWVHSSAMDLYFWNAYYQSNVPKQTQKLMRAISMESLLFALWFRVPYLFKELGFRVALTPMKGVTLTFPDNYFAANSEVLDHAKEHHDEIYGEYINKPKRPGRWP